MEKVDLDWGNIGFVYRKTEYRYAMHWKDGAWDTGALHEDNMITVTEGSPVFHYGQACFEGLKAQTTPDGRVLIFRPDENARRMNRSAAAILMPEIPEDVFVDACIQTVKANVRWVPPHGSGASLYIRPYLIGVGENLGLKSAPEFLFSVFVCPVGPYFKGGMTPVKITVADYDRVAPLGTGAYKVGGNYAASLKPQILAKEAGYADCVFLDAKTRLYIEEIGAANFFGITADNGFVTPKSPSILPSITKYSLMHIAEQDFGMAVEERPVRIDSLDDFVEAGACGTAAVITPIGGIFYNNALHSFYADGQEAGPVTQKLYDRLTGIQRGEQEGPDGWVVEVQ